MRYEEDPEQGFPSFLEWCIEVFGSRKQSVLGHFRHAGVGIEDNLPLDLKQLGVEYMLWAYRIYFMTQSFYDMAHSTLLQKFIEG